MPTDSLAARNREASADEERVLDTAIFEMLANSKNRGADAMTVAGIRAGFRDLLGELDERGQWRWHRWLDAAILRRAVKEWLSTPGSEYMPSPVEFKAVCQFAAGELDREAAAHEPAPALPPYHVADQVDPNDPHSCTPEERKRWAKENAWLAEYGKRLQAPDPETLERLSAVDREYFLSAHQRNVSVANWPNLTPRERRAKEQRIAAEKRAARASLEQRLGWAPKVGIPSTPLGRTDFADEQDERPDPNVKTVQWNDGTVSRVKLHDPPRRTFEERQQRAKEELRDAKPANWLECLCGVQVLEYQDGRRTTVDGRPHYCKWTTLAQQERKGHRPAPRPPDAWDMTERAATTTAGEEPPF